MKNISNHWFKYFPILFFATTLIACSQDKKQDSPSLDVSGSLEEQDFSSMQMTGVEPVTLRLDIDLDAAVQRLSKAVQFQTISNQDRDDFDTEAFDGYHIYLEESYPLVHETMTKEVLGDPRPYSLLYTWEGKDPSLPPVLFYAHQDVVPVPSETLDQWDVDPFKIGVRVV